LPTCKSNCKLDTRGSETDQRFRYTAEVSPSHLRGSIVSFFGVWVSTGSILGAVANNFSEKLNNKLSYQIPLASLFAIPVFLSLAVCFIPESPRWLLVHDRPAEARRALERLRGDSFGDRPELLEEEFQEMLRGIEEEKELASHSSLVDMFKGADLRRTMLCFAVILSHSSSGQWLVISYGVCEESSVVLGTLLTTCARLSSSRWPGSRMPSSSQS
jgi:hypothetical protein